MRPFSFNNPHPLTFQNKELRKLPAKSPQPLDPLLLDNMVTKDGWLKAAMTEDAMVAELLVRIKQVHALAPIKTEIASAVDLPPPRWGVRFPRSRLAFTCSPTKGVGYRRNSPKTPLSWTTGTTSSSGTADGFDDTDLPGCGSSRSKVPPYIAPSGRANCSYPLRFCSRFWLAPPSVSLASEIQPFNVDSESLAFSCFCSREECFS